MPIAALVVSVGAVVALCGLYFGTDDVGRAKYDIEMFKALLQLLVVIGIGTVFKILYDQISDRRKREALRHELRRKLHDDLINRRTQVEEIRRSFVIQIAESQIAKYGESVHELLRIRIELARLWHEFEVSGDLFQQSSTIQDMLEDMKGYLEGLVSEYKDVKDNLTQQDTSELFCSSNSIPEFVEFLDAEDNYVHQFLLSYRTALELIRREMLEQEQRDEFVKIDSPTANSETNEDVLEIVGSVSRPVSKVYVNLVPTVTENSRFRATVDLEQGRQLIRATATDLKGQRSSATVEVLVRRDR